MQITTHFHNTLPKTESKQIAEARKLVAIPLVYHQAYSAPLPSSHRFPMGRGRLDPVIAMGLRVCCDPESQRS